MSESLIAALRKLRDPDPRYRYTRGEWLVIAAMSLGPFALAALVLWVAWSL